MLLVIVAWDSNRVSNKNTRHGPRINTIAVPLSLSLMMSHKHRPVWCETSHQRHGVDTPFLFMLSSCTLLTQAVISHRPDSGSVFPGPCGSLSVHISPVGQAPIGRRRLTAITSTCVTTGRLIWSADVSQAELVINRRRAAWSSLLSLRITQTEVDWRGHYDTEECVSYYCINSKGYLEVTGK